MKKTILNDSILSEGNDERSFPIEKVMWSRTRDIKGNSFEDNRTIFDLQMQNATYYTDFSAGYIIEPLRTVVTYTDIVTGLAIDAIPPDLKQNDLALTIKSSVLEFINSFTIWLNDYQINNPSQYSNVPLNFELLKKGNEDIQVLKDLILYQKNNADSVSVVNLTSNANSQYAPDKFEYNNNISDAFSAVDSNKIANRGRQQRLLSECKNFASNRTVGVFLDPSKCSSVHQNYMTNTGAKVTTATNAVYTLTYNYYACIPLSLLSDFFVKMPIMRGFKLKLDLQENFNFEQNVVVSNGLYKSITTVNSSANGVCPYMLSPVSIDPTSTSAGLIVKSTATDVSVNIKCSVDTSIGTYIHLPQIFYNAFYGNKILENPKKTVLWNDFTVYPSIESLKNVQPGGQVVNVLISQSVIRPRALLLVPYSSANGTIMNYQSPFSSQPQTTAPYCSLSNFNCSINDIQCFQQNYDYKYQHFCEFVNAQSNTGLNLKKNGLMTGQISKSEWERAYCYYYVDLTQYIQSIGDDDLGKSIRVTFTNLSNQALTFFAVVYQERELDVNRATGEITKKL